VNDYGFALLTAGLHEALTAPADPLHLALIFGLSHTTASKYTLIASDLLTDQPAEEQDRVLGEPGEIAQFPALKLSHEPSRRPGHPSGCSSSPFVVPAVMALSS